VLLPPVGEHPTHIGPYAVSRILGTGGMGNVYLAYDPSGVPVAVKVIRSDLARDPKFRARFRSEVNAARRVVGFCTAQVLDADVETALPYLVTEYVEGTPLDRAVMERGPLSRSTLEAFASGVATALTAIHAAGLIHRDLKPGNIVLSTFGPRVIDFGIARSSSSGEQHTMAGEVLGSPGWMSPEQIRGQPVTPAADVFTWAVLVLFAASGQRPFGQGSAQEICRRITEDQPDTSALASMSPSLRRLVLAALDKNPGRRPSAQQILWELLTQPTPPSGVPAVPEFPPVGPQLEPSVDHTRVLDPSALRAVSSDSYPGTDTLGWWAHHRTTLAVIAVLFLLLAGVAVVVAITGSSEPQAAAVPPTASRPSARPTAVVPATPSSSPTPIPTAQRPPQIPEGFVADGALAFRVNNLNCGRKNGSRWCVVSLEATNIGTNPAEMPSRSQILLTDNGLRLVRRLVTPAPGGTGALLTDPIPPGATTRGSLIYELPSNSQPVSVELHESSGSQGVVVDLTKSQR
jgi:eukaryotic-like serine/threonine-protein kinase